MPDIGDEWKPSQAKWVQKYTAEERKIKHDAGNKETVLLQQEEAKQVIEKMRMDEYMSSSNHILQ